MPNSFKFEIKDFMQMIVYAVLIAGAFFALDKRLALLEQKIDQLTLSTSVLADHEKRITILEQQK